MIPNIYLFGCDHRTSPLAIREKLALTGDGLRLAHKELLVVSDGAIQGGMILSTCNRFEVFISTIDRDTARAVIAAFLRSFYAIEPGDVQPCLSEGEGEAVAEHLLRVAAGLESMVLGEPQILGQVAQAYARARRTGAADVVLGRLFEQALHTGKRARAETDISRNSTSVSHAAARLAQAELGDLAGVKALIVGTGEMATHAARALHDHGVMAITCISRTLSHAETLAAIVDGQAANWSHLPDALTEVDVLISATGAPHAVIRTASVMHILPTRDGRPLLMIDIAVPRDIDRAVGDLPGIRLVDIDHLQGVVDDNLVQREAAIPAVEAIVAEELAAFQGWLSSRDVVPTIVDLRNRVEAITRAEIRHVLPRSDGVSPPDLDLLAHRIVQKLLHDPITCLHDHATQNDALAFTQTVRELFALDGDV